MHASPLSVCSHQESWANPCLSPDYEAGIRKLISLKCWLRRSRFRQKQTPYSVRRDVAWRGVAWRGVAWRGVAWRGVAWRGVAWRGVTWRDVTWRDVTWRDVTWRDVTWERHGGAYVEMSFECLSDRVASKYSGRKSTRHWRASFATSRKHCKVTGRARTNESRRFGGNDFDMTLSNNDTLMIGIYPIGDGVFKLETSDVGESHQHRTHHNCFDP